MESYHNLSFNCLMCGTEQSKYLPSGTKITSCNRCGHLITISKISKNRQRTLPRGFNLPEMSSYPYENPNYDSDDYENFVNEEEEFNQFINEPITRTHNRIQSSTDGLPLSIYRFNNRNSHSNDIQRNIERIEREIAQEVIDDEERYFEQELNDYMNNRHSIFNRIQLPEIPFVKLSSTIVTPPKPKMKKIIMNKKLYSKNTKGKLEPPTCCICLVNMKLNDQVTQLKCKHLFHYTCLDKWIQNKEECPFCRGKLF